MLWSLVILQRNWCVMEMNEGFSDVSNCMIHTAEKLVNSFGILASPNTKPVKSLDPVPYYTIEKFCCNDNVHRVMPGKGVMWQLKPGVQKNTNKRDWHYMICQKYMLNLRSDILVLWLGSLNLHLCGPRTVC
jgi:hypothetical protein